jgi:Ca-activated chloride channel family protein
MKNLIILFIVCFMVMMHAKAQYGMIFGCVAASNSNDMLPDVTVCLQYDNFHNIVTYTNENGDFKIDQIIPGRYNLIFFYAGYIKLEMDSILILPGKSVEMRAILEKQVIVVSEVVVRGNRSETLKQASLVTKKSGADLQKAQISSINKAVAGIAGINVRNGVTPSFLGSRANQTGYFINGTKTIEATDNPGNDKIHFHNKRAIESTDTQGWEAYNELIENPFVPSHKNLLSTFSIDVDRAAYSNMRRFINHGQLPPKDAVRTEEVLNYFNYNYPQPEGNIPFSISSEVGDCPWNVEHKLMLVGLQGKIVDLKDIPAMNLVFLIDVSGSMLVENKLPLVISSLKMLVNQLREQDNISIVTYAGADNLALGSTSGSDKKKILRALDNLETGGSTAGERGINRAYSEAVKNFIKDGNNRVIICTDGDFNVGISSLDELENLITLKRKSGVYLSVLGFGMGNYKDNIMETLADKGNGNYAYIDNKKEADKVMVKELAGTLYAIAKDVKIQMEFNPKYIQGYRLIGYENRKLRNEDFENDTVNAGELGSGYSVTALYEIIPNLDKSEQGVLEYDKSDITPSKLEGDEWLYIKLRYKLPKEETSQLIVHKVSNSELGKVTDNFHFSAGAAEFVMLLHQSKYIAKGNYKQAEKLISEHSSLDPNGYKNEFLHLIFEAEKLSALQAVANGK